MRQLRWAILIPCALLVAAGCSRTTRPLSVGSKRGTEQHLLGEIVAQQIESRLGVPVARRLELGDTDLVHNALMAGEIDVYPEYTGTALRNILRIAINSNDADVVFDRVRAVYKSDFQTEWMPPLGFNSMHGAVMLEGSRAIRTLSDAAADTRGWQLGYSEDYGTRPDGLPLLTASYRIPLRGVPRLIDRSELYRELRAGKVDLIAGTSTDGPLATGSYVFLADDKHALPAHEAAVVVRTDTLKRLSGLGDALRQLSGKINHERMLRMNAEIEVKGRSTVDVATEFLRTSGLRR